MATEIDSVADHSVRCEEALRRGRGPEALHLPRASSDRQIRVFAAVVVAKLARSMTFFQARRPQGRAAGFLAIGDQALRIGALVAEQAFQQVEGRAGVAALLEGKVENLAFIVDGAPQSDALTTDGAKHLVEPPARGGRRFATLKLLAICSANMNVQQRTVS